MELMPEPQHIQVAHVLISFAGCGTDASRTKAEAEKLANDVLARANKGEDIHQLIKELSDDPGEGIYGMSNHKVRPDRGEYERGGMVPAFGDVGFKLKVGEVGLAKFDAKKSPFGFHVIKRLK